MDYKESPKVLEPVLNETRDNVKRLAESSEKLEASSKHLETLSEGLNQGIRSLNDGIRTLNQITKNSARRLEYLTTLVILLAIATIVVALIPINPYYALVGATADVIGLIRLYQRAVRDSKQSDEGHWETSGSASVPDISRPGYTPPSSPSFMSGMTRREIAGTLIGAAIILIVFFLYKWGVETYITSVSPSQMGTTTQQIVQVDSFLTGGWIVGFLYYWSQWEKALRKSKRLRRKLRSQPKDAIQFKTAEHAKLWHRMLARENQFSPTSELYIYFIVSVGLFIISGISAINAEVINNLASLHISLELMVGGALAMGMGWAILRYVTQKLREVIDQAMELEPYLTNQSSK